MKTYLVLTLIGKDQPGLVESLALIVAQHHGNWLESNMSHLAGQFAGILKVSVDEDKADELVAALDALAPRRGLVVERTTVDASGDTPRQALHLSLIGNDRSGIIRDISGALARHHVNVDDLETECTPAPMAAGMLFKAEALLHIPADLDIDRLREEIEQLADDLIVELTAVED